MTAERDTSMEIKSCPYSSIEHLRLQSSSQLQTRTVKVRTEKSEPRNPQTALTDKVAKWSRQGSSLAEAIETGPLGSKESRPEKLRQKTRQKIRDLYADVQRKRRNRIRSCRSSDDGSNWVSIF